MPAPYVDYYVVLLDENGNVFNVGNRLPVDAGAVTAESTTTHGEVLVDGDAVPVKWAAINSVALGSGAVVAAVTAKKIRVVAVDMVASLNAEVEWRSGATAIINPQFLAPRVDYFRNYLPYGWMMETAVNTALHLAQVQAAGPASIQGHILYIEVD